MKVVRANDSFQEKGVSNAIMIERGEKLTHLIEGILKLVREGKGYIYKTKKFNYEYIVICHADDLVQRGIKLEKEILRAGLRRILRNLQ